MGYREVREMLCEHLRENKTPVLDAVKRINEVLCQLARAYGGGHGRRFLRKPGRRAPFFTGREFAPVH